MLLTPPPPPSLLSPPPPPPQDHLPLAPCTISALLYVPALQLVAAGCEDGLIRLHYLDGRVPLAADHPLPTQLLGEWGRCVGVCVRGVFVGAPIYCITTQYPL